MVCKSERFSSYLRNAERGEGTIERGKRSVGNRRKVFASFLAKTKRRLFRERILRACIPAGKRLAMHRGPSLPPSLPSFATHAVRLSARRSSNVVVEENTGSLCLESFTHIRCPRIRSFFKLIYSHKGNANLYLGFSFPKEITLLRKYLRNLEPIIFSHNRRNRERTLE